MSNTILSGTIAALLITTSSAFAQERWAIATSSTGSGPYINGSAIAQLVSEKSDRMNVSAQTSGGYNENLSLVAMGQTEVGLTILSDLRDAYLGEGKFAELPNATEIFSPLRRLFPVTSATAHCVVRADSNIRTFEELRGKRLNINVPATATQQINLALLDALGMSRSDFTIFEIATSGSFDALNNGIIDATCNGQPMPSGSILQLAASRPVGVLPFPDDAFERLNDAYGGTMLQVTIPADTYTGQTGDVVTFAYPEVLFVHENADEEMVYDFTKAYFEGGRINLPAFNNVSIENAVIETEPPIHPGALRYFREQGFAE